jgi:hypothetical protein
MSCLPKKKSRLTRHLDEESARKHQLRVTEMVMASASSQDKFGLS